MLNRIFLLLLMSCVFTSAQTHRFIYELQFKIDSSSTDYIKTNMVLDINPKDVKFYEYKFLRMDSINKANQNYRFRTWGFQNIITRERNSFKNKNFENLDDLFVYQTDDSMKWNLSNETKMADQYLLQKATTFFGGRLWTAWFCKEVPYNEGPYKFRGLPGLIFQIYDSKSQFKYNMLQSKSLDATYDTSGFIENYAGTKPLEVSEEMFRKKKLEKFNEPFKDFMVQFDKQPDAQYFYRGTQITSKDQLKTFERQAQDEMMKENNPIEISKVIRYQKK
ncbi:GLPGLI family protein [Chryseobacterium sp. KLBC 52]|uniref:GLPGLI family protein n=1 Tax=Chryseobacterium sp. KLBC 52 TaxID=1862702 RepID=UPI000E0C03E1|nr:GLPGLI family protein [Chryseobacterium sp. KLBC 52]